MKPPRVTTHFGSAVEVIRLATTDPTLVWCRVDVGGGREVTTFLAREDLVPTQLVDQLVGTPARGPASVDELLAVAARRFCDNLRP